MFGDARGGRQLAFLVVGEAGRESGDRVAVAFHQRDDRRRVIAAGEKRAHPARARHVQAHRVVQALDEPLDRLAAGARHDAGRLAVGRRPVTRLAQVAELPERVGSRGELPHAPDQRARAANVALAQVVADRCHVDLGLDAGRAHQRLYLRGEIEHACRLVEVQRLLPEAVAREHQALLARVPHGERKGAAQLLHHFLVPVLVGAQQQLGVGLGFELVAALAQLAAKLGGVEDRAVERERDADRGIGERGGEHHRAPRLAVEHRADVFAFVTVR